MNFYCMKLAYWMYAGPAHIGVLRVSSSFKNVHAIMHAPLGDDYFNVMRSMLERERDFTPVTASIVDRHVLARGSQEKVVENITRKNKEETPDLIILTPTCTSSILQEDLQNFVEQAKLAYSLDAETPPPQIKNEQETLEKNHAGENQKNQVYAAKFYIGDSKVLSSVSSQIVENAPAYVMPAKQANTKKKSTPDVILADVNHYRVNELQAADRTLEQIVRYYIEKAKQQNNLNLTKTEKPSVNIIGIFTLGFHNQHDCRELKRLFNDLGIKINEIIPEGGQVENLKNLPQAWFNFVPYREVGLMTATYLKSEFNMPYVSITPMGLIDTALCIRSICKIIIDLYPKHSKVPSSLLNFNSNFIKLALEKNIQANKSINKIKKSIIKDVKIKDNSNFKVDNANFTVFLAEYEQLLETLFNNYIDQQTRFVSQAAWFSRSIDCQNLTGKKVIVFGDATHSAKITKILTREMGIHVSCAGTYCKHDADWFREQVSGFCDQILITDDHTVVGDTITKLEPAAIFGTQMERHVGKRLNIPCGVISAPVHIQNFPLGYRPFLGYEGTNQIADLVYNSFNLGMEDHLLQIFGGHDSVKSSNQQSDSDQQAKLEPIQEVSSQTKVITNLWSPEGLAELNKVPGFVRGKVKRNTEKYALQNNISIITVEVMYAAKEALSS